MASPVDPPSDPSGDQGVNVGVEPSDSDVGGADAPAIRAAA